MSGSLMRLAAFMILAAATAYPQDSRLDLRQALQIAETDNLELRAARQQRAMALAGITTAGQMPNPTISFGAARDLPHEGLQLDQQIELGGKRGKRIAVAREEQKATDIDITILQRQVRRRTREAFFLALTSRAQTAQAKAALELATRIRDIVRQRFEAGDVAELEVIQAQVEQERASAEYEVATEAEKSAGAQLSALLTRPLDQPWELLGRPEDVPKAGALQSLNDAALLSNAEVQKTTQEIETEQRRLVLAKAQRIPNIDLQAGVDLNSPGDFNAGARGQIGVSLPLFYHGQGEVALSNARLSFLQLSLQAQKTSASTQVVAAYYDNLAKSQQADRYGQKIMPQTVRLEEMAEDSYRSGKSTLLTLIDAQRRLNETRKAYLDTLLQAQDSFAVLEEVVGTPLD